MGVIIEKNMVLATALMQGNSDVEVFYSNVSHVATAGIVQLVGFMSVLVISVVKPWTSRGCGSGRQA